ncbi:hypothetical protein [Leeuwenhoekiella parthenopeia]|uniref:ApeA N-terminal domain-containing protein n=1 Tax=Leeuwenhoekiella parthenopeia TaxID=2890320 RepID=A0ABS8GVS2_9FLAO|nr:hypothetical protein [Leeuwenhoekiella parthenopeia]MCC4214101.1 hypothetical protein [Leeuwenhoekiella parthenopeia]
MANKSTLNGNLKFISIPLKRLEIFEYKLNAGFHIKMVEVENEFLYFNKRFNCKKFIFSSKFDRVSDPSGRLLEIKSSARGFLFKIVDSNYTKNSIYFKPNINNSEISLEQASWYLNFQAVSEYLKLFSIGTVIPKIHLKVLNGLMIPVSSNSISRRNDYKFDKNSLDPYRALLHTYYEEFKENFLKRNYYSSTSLAGSICELILFQLLLEQTSVTESMLRTKGLGTYIEYCRMLELDKEYSFGLTPFENINKLRNKFVHPSNAIFEVLNNIENLISKFNLKKNLDLIIIQFGIN